MVIIYGKLYLHRVIWKKKKKKEKNLFVPNKEKWSRFKEIKTSKVQNNVCGKQVAAHITCLDISGETAKRLILTVVICRKWVQVREFGF